MIYFTSDLHFNHKNIIDYCNRPWLHEEQNQILIDKWNSKVSNKDIVYHLGDMFFHSDFFNSYQIMKQLNGKKHLLLGNHDKETLFNKLYLFEELQIQSISSYKEIKIEKQLYVLCHYPLETWNKQAGGSFMLHGHCHGRLDVKKNRLDVGIDNHKNLELFSIKDVKDILTGI